MKKRDLAKWLLLWALSPAEVRGNGDVVLVADLQCPHTCAPGLEPGYLVEVAQRALEAKGFRSRYEVGNWARLRQNLAQATTPHVVLGLVRDADTEKTYRLTQRPIATVPNCFFVRQSDPWSYRQPSSLAGRKLGLNHGYEYPTGLTAGLQQLGPKVTINRVAGEAPAPQHLQMLLLGRSDTVLQDRLVFEREIRRSRAAGKLRSAGCVEEGDDGFYLGVPAHLPNASVWAQRLDQGVAVLTQSGELARILARYGVTER